MWSTTHDDYPTIQWERTSGHAATTADGAQGNRAPDLILVSRAGCPDANGTYSREGRYQVRPSPTPTPNLGGRLRLDDALREDLLVHPVDLGQG